MELFRTTFGIFASLCLLHEVRAACEQDLKKQQAYSNCFNGYAMYVANAAGSIDQTNPNAMATMLCSAEGKVAVQCLLDYLKRCPDLARSTDPNTIAIFGSFVALSHVGGFDAYCRMMGPGPCTQVQQCVTSIKGPDPVKSLDSPTPYSIMPVYVRNTCGPLRNMLMCFKDVGDQCKDFENTLKTVFSMGKETLPPGTTLPAYEELKNFTLNECPKLPSDFSTNTCVKNNLNSGNFVKCIEDVTTAYPKKNNMYSCPAYQAGYKCIKTEIGAKCGLAYSNAFVKVTPMYLSGAPTNCKLELVTSGSSNVAIISFTTFALILLVLRISIS